MSEIFISYSHQDERWKNRVLTQLRVLAPHARLVIWHDRRIEPGTDWQREIENSIQRCDAALLLISAHFLTSKFILDKEIPELLKRRATHGTRLLPVILSPCAWTAIPWLAAMQARPVDGVPLSSLKRNAAEQALANLAQELAGLGSLPPSRESQETLKTALLHNLPYDSIGELFVGRDDCLQILQDRLAIHNGTGDVLHRPKQVIHGIAGGGKTRLAVEYAWRNLKAYSAVIFIALGESTTLSLVLNASTSCRTVTGPFLTLLREHHDNPTLAGWLGTHRGWLLIIDNVDRQDCAGDVTAHLPQLQFGHVIITSRLANWDPSVELLEIGEIHQATAAAFLLHRTARHRTRLTTDRKDAAALVKELGALALALEQAGAFISRQHCSVADYLERWRCHDDGVSRWVDERLMQYPRSVLSTWDATFSVLDRTGQSLLRMLCWMSDSVPRALLDYPRVQNRLASPVEEEATDLPLAPVRKVTDVLAELIGYSLVRLEDNCQSIRVHRLVQQVTIARMPAAKRDWVLFWTSDFLFELITELESKNSDHVLREQVADQVLGLLTKIDLQCSGGWLPFITADISVARSMNQAVCLMHVGKLALAAASVFEQHARLEDAVRCYEVAESWWRQMVPSDDQKWDSSLTVYRRKRAFALSKLGDPQAKGLAEQLINATRLPFDGDIRQHEDEVSATLWDAGMVLKNCGCYEGALATLKEAKEQSPALSGIATDFSLERASILLGMAMREAGEHARQRLIDLAEAEMKQLDSLVAGDGTDQDKSVEFVRYRIGEFLFLIGRAKEALDYLRPSVAYFSATLPVCSADRLTARNTLANAEAAVGNCRTDLLEADVHDFRMKYGERIGLVRLLRRLCLLNLVLGNSDNALRSEQQAFDTLLSVRGNYLRSDLSGVYLTLRLTLRKMLTPEQHRDVFDRTSSYLHAQGLTWRDFQAHLRALLQESRSKRPVGSHRSSESGSGSS